MNIDLTDFTPINTIYDDEGNLIDRHQFKFPPQLEQIYSPDSNRIETFIPEGVIQVNPDGKLTYRH